MLEVIDEHDTQTVGDFLDWLQGAGYQICTFEETGPVDGRFDPVHKTVEGWLAARHGIDLDEVDREKRAILDHIRRQHDIAELEEIAAETAPS